MSFRLVPISVTLNDLERRNGRYITERLRGVFTTRCYTNTRLPLPLPLPYFIEFGKPALSKTICGRIHARVYCIC